MGEVMDGESGEEEERDEITVSAVPFRNSNIAFIGFDSVLYVVYRSIEWIW